MGKLQFQFKQKECIGCRSCQVACKDKNNLPLGVFIRYVHEQEQMSVSGLTVSYYSFASPFQQIPEEVVEHRFKSCNMCQDLRRKRKNPACVEACPTHCLIITER